MRNYGLVAVAVGMVAGLQGGCASPGYRDGDAASAAMRAAAAESTSTQSHIDAAWKELDAVLATREGDLRPAFDRFAAHADLLQKSVDQLRSRTSDMSSSATAYLSRWERELREVKNDDLRRKSQQRRAEVEERVRKVKELSEQVKVRSEACAADLADVRRVLGTDLTQGGIVTVGDAAARAKASSAALREQAVKLTAELEALGRDIASPMTAAEQSGTEPTK